MNKFLYLVIFLLVLLSSTLHASDPNRAGELAKSMASKLLEIDVDGGGADLGGNVIDLSKLLRRAAGTEFEPNTGVLIIFDEGTDGGLYLDFFVDSGSYRAIYRLYLVPDEDLWRIKSASVGFDETAG